VRSAGESNLVVKAMVERGCRGQRIWAASQSGGRGQASGESGGRDKGYGQLVRAAGEGKLEERAAGGGKKSGGREQWARAAGKSGGLGLLMRAAGEKIYDDRAAKSNKYFLIDYSPLTQHISIIMESLCKQLMFM
jgi:hypothetical protein